MPSTEELKHRVEVLESELAYLRERNDRFDEALGIVLNAWKPGPFSHSGQYYQYEDLDVVPKPVQRPHPPLRLAVNSIASTEYAARRGMPIML